MKRSIVQGGFPLAISGLFACLVGIGLSLPNEPGPAVAVTVSGTAIVLQEDDFENDETRRVYLLKELLTGTIYTLNFASTPPPELLTGANVVVHGISRGDQITVTIGTGRGFKLKAVRVGPAGSHCRTAKNAPVSDVIR